MRSKKSKATKAKATKAKATKKRATTKKRRRANVPAGGGTVTGRFFLGTDPPENRRALAEKMAETAKRFADGGRRYLAKVEKLQAEGLDIVYGQPDLLLVDIDHEEGEAIARDLLGGFGKRLGVVGAFKRRSKSGNWHLHIRLDHPIENDAERVLLQGLFGGDPVRAVLDWLWVKEGHREECFLAEVPQNREVPFSYVDQDIASHYGI